MRLLPKMFRSVVVDFVSAPDPSDAFVPSKKITAPQLSNKLSAQFLQGDVWANHLYQSALGNRRAHFL